MLPAECGHEVWVERALAFAIQVFPTGRVLPPRHPGVSEPASRTASDFCIRHPIEFGGAYGLNGKQASVIWARERWQPPGVARVCFLRKGSSISVQ